MISGEPIRVSPPAALPLSLAELRSQCRLTVDDGTDEDVLLIAYLRAATEYVENYTGLSLITQTWRQTFSAFPSSSSLILSRRPLQSIISLEYLDSSNTTQTIDTGVYRVVGVGSGMRPGSIRLTANQAWPSSLLVDQEAVMVTYIAGFGDTHNDVPEMIRHALMLLVAYWFNQRETALIDPEIVEVPFGTRELLYEWRPLGVA